MSINVSVLNRSMRPRVRSLTRGCDTRKSFAASFCLSFRDLMSFWTVIKRSARTKRCSASSRRNPRSRNTLPVEGVILGFIGHLPSRLVVLPAPSQKRRVPLTSHTNIATRCLPRPFFKTMKHIDCFGEFRQIQYPVLRGTMDPNLPDPGPDHRHRLPIRRLQPILNSAQLEPHHPLRITRKGPYVTTSCSNSHQGFFGHGVLYKL